ncbi:DUF397 domain-containing protein [Streptomyces sp. NPDC058067]|uniref:DUF397 domain-containing protein n=1 Tax=Streptomyces sp. NPDC058067 TaxID=3346324 RepID=UPI0036ED08AF
MPELSWQKSTFSEDQANCVYVATAPDGTIRLRESDAPDTVMVTNPTQLTLLIGQIKRRAGSQPR